MRLQEFKTIAEEIVSATCKILNDAEVVIVDNYGNYMAVDEDYRVRKGTNEWKPYIDEIIRRKEVTIIDNPGLNDLCKGCANEGNCPQTLEVSVPFNMDDTFIGYISVVTFSLERKNEYLKKIDQLVGFLNSMIGLMISAAKEKVARNKSEHMSNELETIINSMHYSVVDCDVNGNIKCTNDAFRAFIGTQETLDAVMITDLIESNEIIDVLKDQSGLEEQESAFTLNNKLHRMLLKATVIKDSTGTIDGFVFTFRGVEDIRSIVYDRTHELSNNAIDLIIGKSDIMKKLKERIIHIAVSSSTVLIKGATGTGKELVARAIHNLSTRKDKLFLTINCAAIPDNLLESELFGYEEGAFTGGRKGGKAGLFEIANGGTIFLDEIGDMPLHLQAKLLRVLQEKEIVRIGGYSPTELDIRVISATHQDLDELIKDQEFRMDLYYRLNVIPITIAPLIERFEDLDELVNYFIDKYNRNLDRNILGYNEEFMEILRNYTWPGNVRELENAIEYAINIETAPLLTKVSVIPKIANHYNKLGTTQTLKDQLLVLENKIISDTFNQYKNDVDSIMKTTKKLGISRASLYRKLKEAKLLS